MRLYCLSRRARNTRSMTMFETFMNVAAYISLALVVGVVLTLLFGKLDDF